MLPTILSDCLCSLQANAKRVAFVLDMELELDSDYGIKIVSNKFSNCLIKVTKNYIYEWSLETTEWLESVPNDGFIVFISGGAVYPRKFLLTHYAIRLHITKH